MKGRLGLAAAIATGIVVALAASASAGTLVQISSDPFSNPTSQHRTQVEPDTFAFGSTIVAAMQTGRSVKWIEDRRENLTAGGHAREDTLTLEAAVKNDGTILGLEVRMILDAGAYQVTHLNPALFTMIVRLVLPGPYRFLNYAFYATVVTTNKAPYVAYRGPWAVETWVREGLADIIAHELGLDPVEVRRKNILTKEEQPYKNAVGLTIERISARETLERAVELADIPRFRRQTPAASDRRSSMVRSDPRVAS